MIYFPELNPFHFIKREQFDFIDTFPHTWQFKSEESFYGIYTKKFTPVWIQDVELSFQLHYSSGDSITVSAWVGGVQTVLGPVDITPAAWNGVTNKVYKYSYTPLSNECFYISVYDGDNDLYYVTEMIEVHDTLTDVVKIEYYNHSNLLGAIFHDEDGANNFIGKIFFKGHLKTPQPGGEYSSFLDDRGNLNKLNAVPRRGQLLEVFHLTEAYCFKLQLICGCSYVKINNTFFDAENLPEFKEVAKGVNFYDASVTMYIKNWGYFISESLTGYSILGTPEDEIIYTPDGYVIKITT